VRTSRALAPIALVLALAPSACRPDGATPPLDARSADPGIGGATDVPSPAATKGSPSQNTEIRSDGIGPIRIGAPLSADLAKVEAYALRLYADAQPLEGFWVGEPPVFAALATGPYRKWLQESGQLDVPPAERFAAAALRDVEGGATIEMVYVEAPGITTPEGVGVGTRYEDFMGAYPDAEVGRIPPLFEEPTCTGQTGALPRVHFFFDRCEDAGPPPADAVVVRIAVR
jgi:hypothetical protein